MNETETKNAMKKSVKLRAVFVNIHIINKPLARLNKKK